MVSELFHSKDFSLLILALLIFFSIFFLIRGILLFLADPKRHHQRRLKQRLRELEGLDSFLNADTLLTKSSLEKSFLAQNLDKFRLFKQLERLMFQADLNWKMGTFLAVAALSGLVGLGVGLMKWGVWGGLAGGGLGVLIPYKVLVQKKKWRLRKFEKQLPDALDLLARGLRAGQTFTAGLQQVGKEMSDPLGTEFFKTFAAFSHGMDLNNALLSLCDRVDLRDLSFFTTAVLIQRETGGNLTEILEKISVLIRERFKLRNQVKALTAEGRLSGIILILLPPVLGAILMTINPEYELQLFHHHLGRIMCGAAVVFQLLSIMLIFKIVNIKV
jgi:tight adherence protein B